MSRKSLQTFFPRVGSQLVTSLIILFCWVRMFSNMFTHLPLYWWKVKQNLQANPETSKQQGHWNGRKWLKEIVNCWLLIHDATWEGNGNAEVYCVVSMNICCVKLTENFGLNQALLSPPGGYLEASLSPGFITWSYPFNLESFLAQGSYYQISKKEVKSL